MKRIYRSTTDKRLGGVCGGIAEYFNVDPTLIRLLAIMLLLFDGIGFFAYLVAWIIFPKKPTILEDYCNCDCKKEEDVEVEETK